MGRYGATNESNFAYIGYTKGIQLKIQLFTAKSMGGLQIY